MKKIYLLIPILAIMFAANSGASAQDWKLYGFMQNTITLVEQTDPLAGHPGIEPSTWGFRVKRAGVGARFDINPMFAVTANLELANNSNVTLDFFGSVKLDQWLNARIGQFIPETQPYEITVLPSRIKLFHYSPTSLNFAQQMMMPHLRDVGMEIYGGDKLFNYAFYVGNGLGRFEFTNGNETKTGIANRKFGNGMYGAKIGVTPAKGLKINAVTLFNNQPDSVHYYEMMNGNTEKFTFIKRRMYNLNYEQNETLVENFFSSSEFSYLVRDDDRRLDIRSWNAQLGYNLTKSLQVAGRYSYYEEMDNQNTHSVADVFTGGLSYFLFNSAGKEYLKLQLNYTRQKERSSSEPRNDMLLLLVQFSY